MLIRLVDMEKPQESVSHRLVSESLFASAIVFPLPHRYELAPIHYSQGNLMGSVRGHLENGLVERLGAHEHLSHKVSTTRGAHFTRFG